MTKPIGLDLAWDTPANEAQKSPLDMHEFELIRLAVIEAFDRDEDCEIEQMVRQRTILPARRRVQVRLERGSEGQVVAIHVTVERDGETRGVWTLTSLPASDGLAMVAAINAFTAALLHAEAARRLIENKQLAEAAGSIDSILANVNRAWRHIGMLCRDKVPPVPSR